MSNTTKPLHPSMACDLLAEAAYQGRDWAHVVRSSAYRKIGDLSPEAAQEILLVERSSLHKMLRRRIADKLPTPLSMDNWNAALKAAEAAFLRCLTGEE